MSANVNILSNEHESHEEWLKKFNKSKRGKMFNLLYDTKPVIEVEPSKFSDKSKKTYLSEALMIATKGTQLEEDAKGLINLLCPEYFTG